MLCHRTTPACHSGAALCGSDWNVGSVAESPLSAKTLFVNASIESALQRLGKKNHMVGSFYFLCYSRRDGEDLALKLADQLAAGPPSIPVWLDRRNIQPGIDWDEQVVEALRGCAGVLYMMTKDSVSPNSECKREWTRGLKYNKPIIPLLFHKESEMPFRLELRQYVDFTHGSDAGMARLREHVRWRATPEGALHTLKERLEDVHRELARSEATDKAQLEEEIGELERQINEQEKRIGQP